MTTAHRFRATTLVFVALALVAAACGSQATVDRSTRDPSTGVITQRGDVGTQRLRVGDCFSEPAEEATEIVAAVPCAENHDSQVTALVELDDDSSAPWPGVSELLERAQSRCLATTAEALNGNLTDPTIGLTAYVPDQRSWEAGDRRIICSLGRSGGPTMTGSLLGLGT